MKRAIITGATGAIGTALVQELLANNIEVLIICRKNSKRNNRIPENSLVKRCFCDLNDLETLQNTTEHEYDVFYHFAWEGTIGNGRNDMYLQNRNVKNALDAVGVAKRFGCHTFIGAGSQAEYGRVEGLLTPDTPTHPDMGYGIAKLCCGYMTRELAHQMGMKHIWVRILSVYGPNDGGKTMIMTLLKNLKDNVVPQCTKGEQKWDYLYSKDAARAFCLLGETGQDGKTYVLGSGKVAPLYEYINKVCEAAKSDVQANLGGVPYGERQVMYLGADISELQKDIGFEPRYTFEDGIKETINWFEENVSDEEG